MTNAGTRTVALMAGIMLAGSAGCITGTHTFSSTTLPTTRYVGIDNIPAPIFDIPSASRNFGPPNELAADGSNGSVVRLCE